MPEQLTQFFDENGFSSEAWELVWHRVVTEYALKVGDVPGVVLWVVLWVVLCVVGATIRTSCRRHAGEGTAGAGDTGEGPGTDPEMHDRPGT